MSFRRTASTFQNTPGQITTTLEQTAYEGPKGTRFILKKENVEEKAEG
jgi:hypothetical protein